LTARTNVANIGAMGGIIERLDEWGEARPWLTAFCAGLVLAAAQQPSDMNRRPPLSHLAAGWRTAHRGPLRGWAALGQAVVLAFAFAASLLASDQHARRFDYRALLAGLGTLLLGWLLLYFFIGFAEWRRTERSRQADLPKRDS
jgi:hypothetical protein